MRYKIVLGVFVIAQILIIVLVLLFISTKNLGLFGSVSVHPIKKNTIIATSSDRLNHFYEPKPNSIETVNDYVYKAEYTINADALNERFDYPAEKPTNTYRIITLGDSFTYGLYVDTKNNWPEQLENKLNQEIRCENISKFEVINLGVQGYDIQYSVERYRLRGQKYAPDLILWFIKLNNFIQINELFFPKMRQYTEEMTKSGELEKEVQKGNLYPAWSKALIELNKKFSEDRLLQMQKGFLEEFEKERNKHIPLIITTFSQTQKKHKKLLQSFAHDHKDVSLFDGITDTYKTNELHFEKDWHPNQKGHKIIAEDIFSYLMKNKLIPCN